MTRVRVARALGLGVASFLVFAIVLTALIEHLAPIDDRIARKAAIYKAERQDIDTLFIGTSRVFFSVDPDVVDGRMKALGCSSHSYVLAFPGLNVRELVYFLKLVRDFPPGRLERLLFEPFPSPTRDYDELMSPRRQRTLALATLRLSITEIFANPRERGRQWKHLKDYLQALATTTLGVGRLRHALLQGIEEAAPLLEHEDGRRGFRPTGLQRDGSIEPFDQGFMSPATQSEFQRRLEAYRERYVRRQPPLERGWRHLIATFMAPTQDLEAQTILLFPPSAKWRTPALLEMVDRERPGAHWLFFDPVRYPDLYDPELWWDLGHLNYKGSKAYSRRIAEALCRDAKGDVLALRRP